ncbi:MAG: PilZ domain-containing protein [Xanthobacteraceae bacterium]
MGIRKLVREKSHPDRRGTPRRLINRRGKIQSGHGTLPRDCLITDISTGGVRLHVEGYDVPDNFVLLLSGEGLAKECSYQVVWRLGHEIGARFCGVIRRTGTASRG